MCLQAHGARNVELPGGEDHLPFVGDQDAILDAIEALPLTDPAQEALPPDLRGELVREIDWHRGRVAQTQGGCSAATFDGAGRGRIVARAGCWKRRRGSL